MFIMCVGAILVGLSASFGAIESQAAGQENYRSIMYYGDWSIEDSEGNFMPKDIPADQLTHLNFAFLDFDTKGNLEFTDEFAAVNSSIGNGDLAEGKAYAGILNGLLDLKAKNPNLNVGISLGGWTKSGDFSQLAEKANTRKVFIDNVLKFIKYTNMDFVDIDWEYPNMPREGDLVDSAKDEGTPHAKPEDKENYVTLLKEFRVALEKQGSQLGKKYELSVALPAGGWALGQGIDVPGIFEVVDFANMMTYDIHGVWEGQSNHHTALYTNPKANDPENGVWAWSANDTVNYLLKNGATADKISIGAAFYARGWGNVEAGANAELPGLFQKADFATVDADGGKSRGAANEKPLINGDGGRNGGIWAFRSLDKLKSQVPGLTEYWDDVAKAPYLYSKEKKHFYTFENERSITAKTDYIKEKQLGGMIVWMQSQDKPSVDGSQRRDQLTTAMKQGLFGDKDLTEKEINYPTQKIKADLKATAVNQQEVYQVTIVNEESLSETDAVLKRLELNAKTIKLPVLTITTANGEVLSKPVVKAKAVTKLAGNPIANQIDLLEAGVETIAPGESVTIQFSTSAAVADLNQITEISLSQRVVAAGSLLATQKVYTKAGEVQTKGLVKVHHQDAKGEELVKSTTLEGVIGSNYEGKPAEIAGYELSQTPENIQGIFHNYEQEVIFVYKAKETTNSSTETSSSQVEKEAEKEIEKEKVLDKNAVKKKADVLPKTGNRNQSWLQLSGALVLVGLGILWIKRLKIN